MLEILIFAAKALIIVLSFGAVVLMIVLAASRNSHKPELEVEALHEKYEMTEKFLRTHLLEKEDLKKLKKEEKANAKALAKQRKLNLLAHVPRTYVLNFNGDLHADEVESLRHEVTAVLQVAQPDDEVLIRLESQGGVVHGYGLAASQLRRIKERGIKLTACVDKVAASGGYMMACVADKIIAAPFAIVGSIGVLAQIPNFNRLIRKYDVDYKEYTAGDFKRTVSILGEITKKGEEHFVSRLEDTHSLFKQHVLQCRPQLQIEKVATGDHWYGSEAVALGLIDEIRTSDDYLMSKAREKNPIFEIRFHRKQNLTEKLGKAIGTASTKFAFDLWKRLESLRLP